MMKELKFKDMKKIFSILAATMMAVSVMAQEEEASKPVSFAYEAGAEIVSAYLWRGQYNGSLSFQPTASIGFDALDEAIQFRAGVWASLGASDWEFKKNKNDGKGYTKFMPEVDVIASFTAYGASVGMNHYYYCDGSHFLSWKSKDERFFDAEDELNSTTMTEIWVGYNFDHFFGQNAYINWYTVVAGADLTGIFEENEDGEEVRTGSKRFWSSYLELGYSYTWDRIGLTLGGEIGMSPWESDLYGNSKFAVTNLSLKLTKEWEVGPCTIDLFAQGSINPDGINSRNAYIAGAGDDKLYNQKLNAALGCGFWF